MGWMLVTAGHFNKFIQENENLTEIQGEIFHSHYWINENGKKLAYMETSSWGAATIYKLYVEGEDNNNLQTSWFIDYKPIKNTKGNLLKKAL